MCILGNFNEDVSKIENTYCCSLLQQNGLKQIGTKVTRDSRTVIDHIYIIPDVTAITDVSDCYYSDHDYVFFLCCILWNLQKLL